MLYIHQQFVFLKPGEVPKILIIPFPKSEIGFQSSWVVFPKMYKDSRLHGNNKRNFVRYGNT